MPSSLRALFIIVLIFIRLDSVFFIVEEPEEESQ